jgi:AcrR family transcriptional regulator
MARTRAGLLDGALRCIEKDGVRRTTMSEIAAVSGVAKATLYNHFRRREDVLAALVAAEVDRLAAEARVVAGTDGADLGAALVVVADRLAEHPAVRRLAADEPELLAALMTVGDGRTWASVRRHVEDGLSAAGRISSPVFVDLLVRWLVSHLAHPGAADDRKAQARVLASSVPPALAP